MITTKRKPARSNKLLIGLVGNLEGRVLVLESHKESEAKRVDRLEECIEKLDDTLDKVNSKLSYWSGAIGLGGFVVGVLAALAAAR